MGDCKKTHCLKGHLLDGNNLVFNSEGFRECRICRNERQRLIYYPQRRKKWLEGSRQSS